MKKIAFFQLLFIFALALMMGCNKKENDNNASPSIKFIVPEMDSTIKDDEVLTILLQPNDLDGAVVKVELFINGVIVSTMSKAPYQFVWDVPNLASAGSYIIEAIACDDQGAIGEAVIHIEILGDYRSKFLGNYNFQVIKESWVYLDPVNEYDTFYCSGVIREFKLEDIPLDLNKIRDETQNEDVTKKITIVFEPYGIITSLIDEYGVLTPKGSIRYNHQGQFTHPDSISFYVGSLGFGNGNGYNYTIQGVRK